VRPAKEGKREGSSSFLKKRTKKLFLSTVRTNFACRVNQQSKSFLVLFFKKELFSCSPLPLGAACCAFAFGVDAEGKSLEAVSAPLSSS
jgi:hypothetical protein